VTAYVRRDTSATAPRPRDASANDLDAMASHSASHVVCYGPYRPSGRKVQHDGNPAVAEKAVASERLRWLHHGLTAAARYRRADVATHLEAAGM
jgi:hypothetical protein